VRAVDGDMTVSMNEDLLPLVETLRSRVDYATLIEMLPVDEVIRAKLVPLSVIYEMR